MYPISTKQNSYSHGKEETLWFCNFFNLGLDFLSIWKNNTLCDQERKAGSLLALRIHERQIYVELSVLTSPFRRAKFNDTECHSLKKKKVKGKPDMFVLKTVSVVSFHLYFVFLEFPVFHSSSHRKIAFLNRRGSIPLILFKTIFCTKFLITSIKLLAK